jgi:hypothetical protein
VAVADTYGTGSQVGKQEKEREKRRNKGGVADLFCKQL